MATSGSRRGGAHHRPVPRRSRGGRDLSGDRRVDHGRIGALMWSASRPSGRTPRTTPRQGDRDRRVTWPPRRRRIGEQACSRRRRAWSSSWSSCCSPCSSCSPLRLVRCERGRERRRRAGGHRGRSAAGGDRGPGEASLGDAGAAATSPGEPAMRPRRRPDTIVLESSRVRRVHPAVDRWRHRARRDPPDRAGPLGGGAAMTAVAGRRRPGGGIEALPFGLADLRGRLVAHRQRVAVVDAKFATDAAARQAVRTYVEGRRTQVALADARRPGWARRAHGRDRTRAIVGPVGEASLERCARVTFEPLRGARCRCRSSVGMGGHPSAPFEPQRAGRPVPQRRAG